MWRHGERKKETRREGLHMKRRGPWWSWPRVQKTNSRCLSVQCPQLPIHHRMNFALPYPFTILLTTWLGSLFQDLRFSCFHLSLQRGRVISQRLVMQERKGGPQTTWVLMTSENFFLRLKEMFQSHKMKWRCLKTQNLRCEHWVPDLGFLGSLNRILQGTQYEALTGQSLIL